MPESVNVTVLKQLKRVQKLENIMTGVVDKNAISMLP